LVLGIEDHRRRSDWSRRRVNRILAIPIGDFHNKICQEATYAPQQTGPLCKRIAVGNVIPKLFAVFTLMTSSNFVGNSAGNSAGLAPRSTLHQIVFAEADLVAVLPKGHPLAACRTIRMQHFATERFIALRPTTLLRAQIDMAAARVGLALNPRIETTSGATACELAARGLGVTVADPVLAASFREKGIEVRPLVAGLRLTYGFLVPGKVADGHPICRVMGVIARTAARIGGRFVTLEPQWKKAIEDRP
jgi:hypothetical protein